VPVRAVTRGLAILVALAAFAGAAPRVGAQSPCRSVAVRSPSRGEAVQMTVPILGSAQINAFNFYKLEWAPSSNPEAWRAVSEVKSEPVINGLLDQWNTGPLPDGLYRLKLTAVDRSAAEVCKVTVEDIQVANSSQPLPTETPLASTTPTATETPAESATERADTATPVEATTEIPATEARPTDTVVAPTVAATATLSAILPTTAGAKPSGDGGTSLGVGALFTAFTGGFLIALILAGAALVVSALRQQP
jgi:hypothetical protein